MLTTTSIEHGEAFLRDRQSWPAWFLQLQFDSTFRNVWQYVNPSALDAPHLIAAEPQSPPTINELLDKLNDERAEPTRAWDMDERLEAEKGARPRAPRSAKFEDIKEEHAARLKSYTIEQASWVQRSGRYQHIWNWVRSSVDEELLRPHLETLVREDKVSLQNVVRRLQAQFAPSDDVSADRVRQEYRRVLEVGKRGTVNPQRWYEDWFKVLCRARTYRLPEIEGFLAIKDFLDTISAKLSPTWGAQQLANVIVAKELGEPIRTLEEYGRAFESLAQHSAFVTSTDQRTFATFGGRPDRGYACPCKDGDRHPWRPVECSLLEYAIKGTSERRLSLTPTAHELELVRQRLRAKQWSDLREALVRKGWPVKESGPEFDKNQTICA